MLPESLANDKLQNLIRMGHKIEMCIHQMLNFGMDKRGMQKLYDKREKLRKEVAEAAIELMDASIEAEDKLMELKMQQEQTQITTTVESPLDYSQCDVGKFPFSYDSIKFDVQFFKLENNEDETAASNHASSVVEHTRKKKTLTINLLFFKISVGKAKEKTETSNHYKSVMEQTSRSGYEGTVSVAMECFCGFFLFELVLSLISTHALTICNFFRLL